MKPKGKNRKDDGKDTMHNEMDMSTDEENDPYTGNVNVSPDFYSYFNSFLYQSVIGRPKKECVMEIIRETLLGAFVQHVPLLPC